MFDNILEDTNQGFVERQRIFMGDDKRFTPAERTFMGRLYHDLNTLKTGIPPGVKVTITLFRNKTMSKVIDCFDPAVPADLYAQITKLALHVPTGIMNEAMYSEYQAKLNSGHDPVMRFRRLTTKKMTIEAQTTNFETNILFGIDTPARYFLLIKY